MPAKNSVPISPIEFIEVAPTEQSPLISKVQIKVCYVGEEPNRNGSIITKETAEQMAPSLRGVPIVGYYNEDKEDFEEHNRKLTITNSECKFEDMTRPYGFVSTDAKVWFQKFSDDGVEHEYLCTEGYIWTEIYEQSKRIAEKGNGQSMEFEKNIKGSWTADDNGFPEFFIISEALIEKLCILGEDVEPCFEGAAISTHFSLSLDEDFKHQVFKMIEDIEKVLNKGGNTQMDNVIEKNFSENEDKSCENDAQNFQEEVGDDNVANDEAEEQEEKQFTLEEIPEYVELSKNYTMLQKDYDVLQEEVKSLRSFKASAERAAKEDMIKSFYMLSDADKKDCLDNIDKYSLDEIEAKLSIICVRNKVNFNLDEDKEDEKHPTNPTVYTLGDNDDGDAAPAWIKAVRNTAKEMN